jgi:tetratricopeptide (TPR) repeat protein
VAIMSTFYEAAVERALATLAKLPGRPKESDLMQRCERLLAASEAQRATLLRNSVSFASPYVANWLVDFAFSLRHEDPVEAVQVAHLSRLVAESLGDGPFAVFSADTRARSYAYLGNALRVVGDLQGAHHWLDRASEVALDGSGDPLCLAETARFRAVLSADARAFEPALRLYLEAFRTYMEVDETHLGGRVLVSLGRTLDSAGKSDEALDVLERSFSLIEVDREPELLVSACHFLAQALASRGQGLEALRVLRSVAPLSERIEGAMVGLRARWMEATVLAELRQYREAVRLLRSVANELSERKLHYEAALAQLDLACALVAQGDSRAASNFAAGLYPRFLSHGLADRALAALLVVQRAAKQEALSVAVLKEATLAIRSAQRAEWGERLQSLGAR